MESRHLTPIASIRLGLCAGFDPSCVLANGKLEVTTKYLGFQATFPDMQIGLKLYFTDSRVFFYGAKTQIGSPYDVLGVGIGRDIHLKGLEHAIIQPQFGFQSIQSASQPILFTPSLSLGIAFAFGKAPDWTKPYEDSP